MKKVLFVCSGNTCRSPIAEGIAKKVLPEYLEEEIEIMSAGSAAVDGLPASSLAIEVAADHSIELSNHRAKLLSRTLVKEADLIVTMSPTHKDTVGVIEPTALEYTYVLPDFCDDDVAEIPDPIGLDRDAYEKTFELIENCVGRLADQLGSFNGWKNVKDEA